MLYRLKEYICFVVHQIAFKAFVCSCLYSGCSCC